jgi:hypothetical protein bcoam_21369
MNFEQIKSAFNQYFVDVLKNHYIDYQSRMSRKEFWMFVLFTFIITFVVSLIAGVIRLPILSTLVALALIVPSIMADIRRFRDLGISPWWLLAAFVPFIGGIAVLIALCMPADSLKALQDKIAKK